MHPPVAARPLMNHARILLKANTHQEGGGWTDVAISQALDLSVSTIERVRQRFVETNLETALSRQVPQTRKPHRLDGEQEAHLMLSRVVRHRKVRPVGVCVYSLTAWWNWNMSTVCPMKPCARP